MADNEYNFTVEDLFGPAAAQAPQPPSAPGQYNYTVEDLFGSPEEEQDEEQDEEQLFLERTGTRPLMPDFTSQVTQGALDVEASRARSTLEQQFTPEEAEARTESVRTALKGVDNKRIKKDSIFDSIPFVGVSDYALGEQMSPTLMDTLYRQPIAGTRVSYKTQEKEQAIAQYGLNPEAIPKDQATELYDKLVASGLTEQEAADTSLSAFPHAAFQVEEIADNASYDERTYAWLRRKTIAGPMEGAGLVESPGAAAFRWLATFGPRVIYGAWEEATSYESIPGEFDPQGLPKPSQPNDQNYQMKRAYNKYVRNDDLREAIKNERPAGAFDVTDPEWMQLAKEAGELPEEAGFWSTAWHFTGDAMIDFLKNPLARPYDVIPEEREDLRREIARVRGARAPGREGPSTGSFLQDLSNQIVASTYAGDDLMESYSYRLQKAAAGELDTFMRDAAIKGMVHEVALPGFGGPYSLLSAVYKTRRGVTPLQAAADAAKGRQAGRLVEGMLEGAAAARGQDIGAIRASIGDELKALPPDDDSLIYLSRKFSGQYAGDAVERIIKAERGETVAEYADGAPISSVIKEVDGYVNQVAQEIDELIAGTRGINMDIPMHRQIAGIAVGTADDATKQRYIDFFNTNLKNDALTEEQFMNTLNTLNARYVSKLLKDDSTAAVLEEMTARRLAAVLGRETGMTHGFTQVTDNIAISNKAAKSMQYQTMLKGIDQTIEAAVQGGKASDANHEVARLVAVRNPDMAYKIFKEGVEAVDPLKLIRNMREGAVINASKANPAISPGAVKHFEDAFFDNSFVNSMMPGNRQATGWRNIKDLVALTGTEIAPVMSKAIRGLRLSAGGPPQNLPSPVKLGFEKLREALRNPMRIPEGLPKQQGMALLESKRRIATIPSDVQDEVLKHIAAGQTQERALKVVSQGMVNRAIEDGVVSNALTGGFETGLGGMKVYKSVLTKLFPTKFTDADADALRQLWDSYVRKRLQDLARSPDKDTRDLYQEYVKRIGKGDMDLFDDFVEGFVSFAKNRKDFAEKINAPLEHVTDRLIRKMRDLRDGFKTEAEGDVELAKLLTVLDLERQRRIAEVLNDYAINSLDKIDRIKTPKWLEGKEPLQRKSMKAAMDGKIFSTADDTKTSYNIANFGDAAFNQIFRSPAAYSRYIVQRAKSLLIAKANELEAPEFGVDLGIVTVGKPAGPFMVDQLTKQVQTGMEATLRGSHIPLARRIVEAELGPSSAPGDLDDSVRMMSLLLTRADLIRNSERLDNNDRILMDLMKDPGLRNRVLTAAVTTRQLPANTVKYLQDASESIFLRLGTPATAPKSVDEMQALPNAKEMGYPKQYDHKLSKQIQLDVEIKLAETDGYINETLLPQRPSFPTTKKPEGKSVEYVGGEVYDQAGVVIKQVERLGQSLVTDTQMMREIQKLLDSGLSNNIHTRMAEWVNQPSQYTGGLSLARDFAQLLGYMVSKTAVTVNAGLLGGVGLPRPEYLGNNVFSQVLLNSVTNPGDSVGLITSSMMSVPRGIGRTLAEIFPEKARTAAGMINLPANVQSRLGQFLLQTKGGRMPNGDLVLSSGLRIKAADVDVLAQRAGLAERSLEHMNMSGDLYREIQRHGKKGAAKAVDWLNPTIPNANNKLAMNMDYAFRRAAFERRLMATGNFEDAAEIGRRSVLDYSDMTNFERNYVTPLVPFYSFARTMTMELLKGLGRPGAAANIRRNIALSQRQQRDTMDYNMYPEYVRNYMLAMELPQVDYDTPSLFTVGRNPILEQTNALLNGFASEQNVAGLLVSTALGQNTLLYQPFMDYFTPRKVGDLKVLSDNDLMWMSQNPATWSAAQEMFELYELPEKQMRPGRVSAISSASDEFGKFQKQYGMTEAGAKRYDTFKLAGISLGFEASLRSNFRAAKMAGFDYGPELDMKGRERNPMFMILGTANVVSGMPVDHAEAAFRMQLLGDLKKLQSMGLNPATGEMK